MKLIDADALPHSWQPDCNGNRWFVSGRAIDAAPAVCCEECARYGTAEWTTDCELCRCASNFERRQPPPPRSDCRYCVDPTDHIPGCDTPERKQRTGQEADDAAAEAWFGGEPR